MGKVEGEVGVVYAEQRVLNRLWVRRPDAKVERARNAPLEEVDMVIALRG